MTGPSEDSVVLASAARFLVDGGEEDAASVLLSCSFSLEFWRSGDTWYVGDEIHDALHVKLIGPRAAYEILNDSSHPTTQAIRRALEAVLPEQTTSSTSPPSVASKCSTRRTSAKSLRGS